MSSRMFWVAVGAAGGIVVYRRGQRTLAEARERGVVGNVAAIAASVSRAATALSGPDSGEGDRVLRMEAIPADRVIDLRQARTGTRG